MAELIGVIDGVHALQPPFLKRTALLFDRIALPEVDEFSLNHWSQTFPNECNELLWLIDRQIVFQAEMPRSDTSLTAEDVSELELFNSAMEETLLKIFGDKLLLKAPPEVIILKFKEQLTKPEANLDTIVKVLGHFLQVGEHISRLFGCLLRSQGMKAYPVLSTSLKKQSNATPSEVIQIVFSNFPTPSEHTPWEQILEYREDPDSRATFLALRNWMNETIRANLPPTEIAENLEYLLSEYQRHLKLHKMKATSGIIETVVVSGAQIAENLVRLKFSDIAKIPFAAKHRKLALYEGELTLPGHELAYILKTQEVFHYSSLESVFD